jgi:hypothetical protein
MKTTTSARSKFPFHLPGREGELLPGALTFASNVD